MKRFTNSTKGTSSGFSERMKIFVLPLVVFLSVAAFGYALFLRSRGGMERQLREHLVIAATLGAVRFDAKTVQSVGDASDVGTPAFNALVNQLQDIREADPLILYAYIMRRTGKPNALAFVADADSAVSRPQLDRDEDGLIGEDEEPALPGDLYDVTGPEFSIMRSDAFVRPSVDSLVTTDKWGAYISGYAPIRDATGNTVAILGIDMDARQFAYLSQSAFSPFILIIVVLAGLSLAGYILYMWNRYRVSMLKRIDKERSGLLQLTFHQLGEPITIMQWSLETLSDNLSLQQLEKVVPEHITTMNEGLRRLNGIIDVLQFAEKIDLGSIQFNPQKIELAPVLGEVAEKYKLILSASVQTLDIQCDPGITLFADKDLLKVVLSEIIGNAIAYSTKNCMVDVRVHPEHRTVHIEITDQGCGIPKEDMNRLFEKYMRGSNARLRKPDGNGLGLYICKGIVEGMDGSIEVDSVQDQGTTVTVVLPM